MSSAISSPSRSALRAEIREVVERAELGMHALVAALGAADRPRRARDRGRSRRKPLLRPLRWLVPIGWIGGK